MEGISRTRKNLRFTWRVIKLLLRGFALVVFTVLLILVAAFFYARSVFDAEQAKSIVTAQLEELLHRPVQIEGVVLTLQGIKLRGVRVIGKTGSLLQSESAVVAVKLEPLFQRRLELRSVRLVEPRVILERDASGRWNIADLFPSTAAARAPETRKFLLPVSLAADSLLIEGGVLDVNDRLLDRKYQVTRFNMNVDRFDVEAAFPFTVSFDNVSRFDGRELKASCSLSGSAALASFDWAAASLDVDRIVLDLDGTVFRGKASVAGFSHPVLTASVSAPALGPEQWRRLWGKELDLAVPESRWSFTLRSPGPDLLEVSELKAVAGPLSLAAQGTVDRTGPAPSLAASLKLSEFPLDKASMLRPAWAPYDLKGALRGEASVSGWPGRWALREVKLSLRGIGASFPGRQIDGGNLELSASDDFSKVSLSASSGALTAYSEMFTDIALSASLNKKDIKVENLSLKWGPSRLKLKARVLDVSNPKEVSISGNMDRLRWEDAQRLVENVMVTVSTRASSSAEEDDEAPKKPWVETFKYVIPRKFPDTIGHFHIGQITHKNFSFSSTDFLWDIRGITPSLKKAAGDVKISIGRGRVEDIQAVQSAHKILRIVFLPYIYMYKMNKLSVLSAATAYPQTLDFNRIEGQYAMSRGVATTRFFYVDSPQLVAYSYGIADFASEKVDMNVLTRLTGYHSALPDWWVDVNGNPAIGFRVKGDLNQPDLEPRLRKMGSREIENALDEARRKSKGRFEAIEKLRTL